MSKISSVLIGNNGNYIIYNNHGTILGEKFKSNNTNAPRIGQSANKLNNKNYILDKTTSNNNYNSTLEFDQKSKIMNILLKSIFYTSIGLFLLFLRQLFI